MSDHVALALKTIYSGRYRKNISYFFADHFDADEFALVQKLGGASAQVAYLCEQIQRLSGEGVQLQISKQVSDDLMQTDFHEATEMEEIPWPGLSVEVFFEDPGLPTILLCHAGMKKIAEVFPQLYGREFKEKVFMGVMQDDTMKLTVRVGPEEWPSFIRDGLIQQLPQGAPFDADLVPEDNASVSFMAQLAFKAFVFASIPQFKPSPLTRSQMHWGGKPGVKRRPTTPVLKIQYLPRVVTMKQSHAEPAQHAFRGRRGHIRYYRHVRFTNKQGTWDYIAPVPGPDGKYPVRVIKVRKPHLVAEETPQ